MMKRSFFLSLAAGLVASLAFTGPSQAGYVVETVAEFSQGTGSAKAADFEITYSGLVSGPFTIKSASGGFAGVTPTASGDIVTFNFSGASTGGSVDFTFTTSNAGLSLVSYSPTGVTNSTPLAPLGSSAGAQLTGGGVQTTAVPEPSTMGLLGIGMTGFLAFRRFLKRTKVV